MVQIVSVLSHPDCGLIYFIHFECHQTPTCTCIMPGGGNKKLPIMCMKSRALHYTDYFATVEIMFWEKIHISFYYMYLTGHQFHHRVSGCSYTFKTFFLIFAVTIKTRFPPYVAELWNGNGLRRRPTVSIHKTINSFEVICWKSVESI